MRLTISIKTLSGIGALLPLLALAGCQDRLPTASGSDRFPGGMVPTTLEFTIPASGFLVDASVFSGYADRSDATYLLVANRFDGELMAHALARPTGFPDAVTYDNAGASVTDSIFTYISGEVTTVVDSAQSTGGAGSLLFLWELEQAWDSATVSWELAANGPDGPEPWRVPGGTATMIDEAIWMPDDSVAGDTVTWDIGGDVLRRLADGSSHGLMVTGARGSRFELSRLSVTASIRPETRPDTILERSIFGGPQTFIFTPDLPDRGDAFEVGGLLSSRTILTLDVDQSVPACANPGCASVPLSAVTLNQAVLVLDPVPVPAGFRPFGPTTLSIRTLSEVDLGRLAPLGQAITSDSVSGERFADPAGEPLVVTLTGTISGRLASDSTTFSIALLGPPEGRQFGYQRYAPTPVLRLVYTLPQRPDLP
jgi:hypothetical protein